VNAPNPKRPAKKNQKHPESPKRPAMALAISLATNLIAIAATRIALTNARRSLMLTISPLLLAMMTSQHQKLHYPSANTQIGAHGLHAVQPVSIATIQEPDRDREIVTKHQIVNVKIIYMKRKSVQLMTQLLLVNANSATGVNGARVPNHATVELRPDLVRAHVETVMEIRSKLANVIHTVARTCLNHKMEKNSVEPVSITVPRNQLPAVPTDQMIVLSLCLMAARASVMLTVSEKKVTVAPITLTNVCQISSQQWCPRLLLLRGCLKATQFEKKFKS